MTRPIFRTEIAQGPLALLCLSILGVIVVPARSESGPAPQSVAKAIARAYLRTQSWPRDVGDFSLGPHDRPGRRYGYRLVRGEKGVATYRIVVNGRSGTWRILSGKTIHVVAVD